MNKTRLEYQSHTGISASKLSKEIESMRGSSTWERLYDYIVYLENKIDGLI